MLNVLLMLEHFKGHEFQGNILFGTLATDLTALL